MLDSCAPVLTSVPRDALAGLDRVGPCFRRRVLAQIGQVKEPVVVVRELLVSQTRAERLLRLQRGTRAQHPARRRARVNRPQTLVERELIAGRVWNLLRAAVAASGPFNPSRSDEAVSPAWPCVL